MRLLRRPLACSWRSLSICNTTAAVALFLYIRERRTISSIWLSLLVFSLSLCVSVSRRFSSLPALCFRLCRRSAFVSAGTQRLVSAGALLSLLSSGFSSLLCTSELCSSGSALPLISASPLLRSPLLLHLSLLCIRSSFATLYNCKG